MRNFRLAMAQINTTVGALPENRRRIAEAARKARDAGAALVVFPEMSLCGYPPEDLVLKPHFIEAVESELEILKAEVPSDLVCVVGLAIHGTHRPRNAAAVLHGGEIHGVYAKQQLPNYGVFDEWRVFEPGTRQVCLEVNGRRFGLHICEDSWVHEAEGVRDLADLQLSALLNLSASPFHRGKLCERMDTLSATSRIANAPLAYCNLVGGQDELVFDGGSLAINADGDVHCSGKRFEEDLVLVDLPAEDRSSPLSAVPETFERIVIEDDALPESDPEPPRREPSLGEREEVYRALCLGLRDYADKNNFKQVLIAISGGIDSALVAALAVDALGPERVTGVSLPTRYSSEGTRTDAIRLAENLGVEMPMLPIQALVNEFLTLLEPQWPDREEDVTEENLQARIRGTIVMALSNKFGRLVVATGNKSEMATGYATLYGDMCGGYALIKDVPKTLVFDLCRWINEQAGAERIPQSLIDRPPSAELREDQQDADSLPPYEILDGILVRYIERDMGRDAIVADGFDPDLVTRVLRMVDGNEYKRRQAPPGVKITPKAFGRDRRIPITNHFRPTSPTRT